MSRSHRSAGLPRAEAEALKADLTGRLARRLFPTFTYQFEGPGGPVPAGVALGLTAVGKDRFQVAIRYLKDDVPGSRRKVRLDETIEGLRREVPGTTAVIDATAINDVRLGAGGNCTAHPMWRVAAAGSYRHRPVPPGAPIASELELRAGGSFGSVCCYLKDPTTNEPRLLTCTHVVQDAADQPEAGNRFVLQAPRALGGFPDLHRCATVVAARIPDVAVVNPPETALCAPLPGAVGTPPNAFGPPGAALPKPLRDRGITGLTGIEPNYEAFWYHPSNPLHRFVHKVGARTGWTSGVVRSVLDRLDVHTRDGLTHFDGPILEITGTSGGHFALPCDSGAPVLTGDGRVLGMLFATSEVTRVAYAFTVNSVLATWPGYVLV